MLALDKAAVSVLQDCVITGKVGARLPEKANIESSAGSLTIHYRAKIVGDRT